MSQLHQDTIRMLSLTLSSHGRPKSRSPRAISFGESVARARALKAVESATVPEAVEPVLSVQVLPQVATVPEPTCVPMFTANDVATILNLYNEGEKVADIASRFHVSLSTCYKVLKNHFKHGLRTADLPEASSPVQPINRGKGRPRISFQDSVATVVEMVKQGKRCSDIVKITGLSPYVVSKLRREYGLSHIKNTKSTEPLMRMQADLSKIKEMVAAGAVQSEIAKLYATTQGTVSDFCIENDIPASNGRGRRRKPMPLPSNS